MPSVNKVVLIGHKNVEEIWVPIPGLDGLYEASDRGKIKSLMYPTKQGAKLRKRPLILKPKTKKNGYLEVGLNKNGIKTMYYVHRLILLAFYGQAPYDSMEVDHRDGNKRNCALSNLRWFFHKDNVRNSNTQKGEQRYNAILTEESVKKIRSEYVMGGIMQKDLATRYHVNSTTIRDVLIKKTWKHVGVINA
jgi:hypothetical protein